MVEAQRHNVRVGFGTDVAGGHSPSLLVNCRHAVLSSKLLARKDASVEIDFKRAFWTATLGGARALGLEDHLGSFAVGKQFDACVSLEEDDEPAVLNARDDSRRARAAAAVAASERRPAQMRRTTRRSRPNSSDGSILVTIGIGCMCEGASCTSRICERDVCL